MNSSHRLRIVVLALMAILLCVQPTTAQTKKRVIQFRDWSSDNIDNDVLLELIEIRISGRPVVFDQTFEASDDWLKKITLRIKNIGKKPIATFDVGGGLLLGVAEELPMHASFKYAITWKWGKYFNTNNEKPKGAVLKPGETVELSYLNVDSLTRRTLAQEGEGAFCKLKVMLWKIQYTDGSSPSMGQMRLRKTP